MADLGSTANLAGTATATAAATDAQESQKKQFNYPLIRMCDMIDELRVEAVDMVVTAVEKHPGKYEVIHFYSC